MSFFKTLFGLGSKATVARKLSHPRELMAGDIIKFGFLNQTDVSGNQFEVSQVNTYLYGNLGYPELVLKDRSGHIVFMMVEEDDGEEYLALSKKVPKAVMHDVLAPEDLEAIKTVGAGTKVKVKHKSDGLIEWLANKYCEVDDAIKGAYLKGDARFLTDEELTHQERFSSYVLEDAKGEHAIEIAIYDSGEIEMSVTVYLDVEEIEEMWPRHAE
jgi:hypothetical protein